MYADGARPTGAASPNDLKSGIAMVGLVGEIDCGWLDTIAGGALIIQAARRRERREEIVGRLQRWRSAGKIGPFDPRPLHHHDVVWPHGKTIMRRIGACDGRAGKFSVNL